MAFALLCRSAPTRYTNIHHQKETPLLEIHRASKTMEEQRERIFDAGCEALELLQYGGHLDKLRDECEAVA